MNLFKGFLTLTLFLAGVRSSVAQEEPPRLRSLLKNGATILVDNLPKAKYASVQLFASNRYLSDTPETHGYRHLLEHLILKGKNKDLDTRLEKQGIWMMGRTLRDAIQIEIICSPEQIDTALSTLKELLQPLQLTPDEIKSELPIMREEFAIESDAQRLSIAAWSAAYGPEGLDPFGSLDALARATPESLREVQKVVMSPKSLVLVVSGPEDVEVVTKKCRSLLQDLVNQTGEPRTFRPDGVSGRTEVDTAFGEARAARVRNFRDATTAWTLAAALAIASQSDGAFVTYTPSAENGLIIVGHTDSNNGLGTRIDEMADADAAQLYGIGKVLAERWVDRQLTSPSSSALARGLLLAEGPSYKPEQMLENIQSMTWPQFLKGFALFRKEQADIVVGTRH